MITVKKLEGDFARTILEEIYEAIDAVCKKNGVTKVNRGLFNSPSGLGIGIGVIGQVDGVENEKHKQFVYPLGLPVVNEITKVSLDDYNKSVKYKEDEYKFIGLICPRMIDYNVNSLIGRDDYIYIFGNEEEGRYLYLDKDEALGLLGK